MFLNWITNYSFKWSRLEPTSSLFWLLEEPLVHGARLDVQDRTAPGLTCRLCDTGNVNLRNIVDVAGPGLRNTAAVASRLGFRSQQYTRDILHLWTERLTKEELEMLQEYNSGIEVPDCGDPFPEMGFSIDLEGLAGPLLKSKYVGVSDLYMTTGKMFYEYCVKASNKLI